MTMEIEMETLVKRFRDYISFDTQSDENSASCPSTPKQMILAKHLAEELKAIGLEDVDLDENGYIMATLPANGSENAPVVGFIAHMDTSPDASGADIHEQIIHYEGGDILLNPEKNIVFSVKDFPEIQKYKGQDIMMTNGTTLLGADDKAGITSIVSAAEYLLQHPEIKHGKVRLGFTPDEEIGRSSNLFDVEKFGADFAFTIDGGELGGLEYENFNAANPEIVIHGRSVHTGSGKGKMKNAVSIAAEWQMMLPAGEKPEYTEGHEGFFHVHKIKGGVEQVTLGMLIRDHDKKRFAARKAFLDTMAEFLNKKYGEGTIEVHHRDMYYNMLEKIADGNMYIVDLAHEAMEAAGVEPNVQPIRGGTDGARLSFRGLPCPNIFTGGANFHGRFEYLPLPSLQKAANVTLAIMVKAGNLKKS